MESTPNTPAAATNKGDSGVAGKQVKKDIITAIASETLRAAAAGHNYNKETHEKDAPV